DCNSFPPCKALISLYDAKIQTIQACLISSEFAKNRKLKDDWERIYSVTAFYVGFSDDLGPYEYLEALNSVFNGEFDPNNLTQENLEKLKAKLAEFRSPKIYGATGEAGLWPPFTPEQADKVLALTAGFRLMGQRFVPDSYMFSNLVSPYVGMYTGKDCKNTFTCEFTDGGPARTFPRGLDVMALLGSKRAKELLQELGDTEYEGRDKKGNKITHETQFLKLKEEFDKFNESDWQKNLYWSWLYALKPLLKEFGKGYPTFMQTKAWQDKELTTALASWAELRHDTILYAKQSYTMNLRDSAAIPSQKPVVGYVEPVPEFYNRLLALTKMTNRGLSEMDVLDEMAKSRLNNLERILERLVEISKKELQNEELTKDDYDFIKNFGEELNGVIDEVPEKSKKTTIIADVHTDQNTRKVLEEGIGYVRLIAVAYKLPDNRILIGAGPVFSYYEFKHPMEDRLTDKKWRKVLKSNQPEEPEWIPNFGVTD
ncbi:MAG: dTDP-glucose 4,6-dehydratase, partial [Candidatus Altiarchaeales archaeon]